MGGGGGRRIELPPIVHEGGGGDIPCICMHSTCHAPSTHEYSLYTPGHSKYWLPDYDRHTHTSTHTPTPHTFSPFDFPTPIAGGDDSDATAEAIVACAGIAPFNRLQG